MFSFQQKNSPHKDPQPLDRKPRVDDAIEEVDEEARSSRDEAKAIVGRHVDSFEGSQPEDDEEDLDEVIEKLSSKNLAARSGYYSKKSTEKHLTESIGHKLSLNSNGSGGDPYAKSRDLQMLPHYHQLLQKGKPIDIKQSAGTAKTEARSPGYPNESSSTRRGEEPRVTGFKLEDASKKPCSKEESLGTTFDSARRHLLKTIGESYQSKESLNSLARSSRGKETLSQFDSEQPLKPKDAPGSRFNKLEAAAGTQSLECRATGLHYASNKDLEKKAQSTGYSLRAGPDPADKQSPDADTALEAKRAARLSRSPIRDFTAPVYEKEPPSVRNNSRPALANSQLDNMSAKNSQKAHEQPAVQALHASNLTGYLDRFQRKRMHHEEKTPLEAFRKSGINFQPAGSREQDQRRDPMLDMFLLNNKQRTDSNPKSNHSQQTAARPNGGGVEQAQPEGLTYQHAKKGPSLMRESRVAATLLPGPTERRSPMLDNIMKKVPVSRKEDLLVTSRNRPLEDQENLYCFHKDAFEERLTSDYLKDHAATKLPVKGQSQALANTGGQRAAPTDGYAQKQSQRNAGGFDDNSSFKAAAGQSRPVARQSQEAANMKRSPSGNGGFNIKIDIGNLSSKMMANIQRDLP